MISFLRFIKLCGFVSDGRHEYALRYWQLKSFKGRVAIYARLKVAQAMYLNNSRNDAIEQFEISKREILEYKKLSNEQSRFLIGFAERYLNNIRAGSNDLYELEIDIEKVPKWMITQFHYGYKLPGDRY